MRDMPRVRAIFESAFFESSLDAIEAAEVDREFCRHGLSHLLDVARVAQLLNLERGLGLDRELIYAAALLHDLGRAAQYETGEPHDEAGTRIAREILEGLPAELAFAEDECAAIFAAVRGHRGAATGAGGALTELICEADHRSRPCYACPVREDCYWPEERKNAAPYI